MIFASFMMVSVISIVIWILYRGYLYNKNKSINLIRESILLLFFVYFLILLNITVFKSGGIVFVNPLNTYGYKHYGIGGIVNYIPLKETIATLTDGHIPIMNPIRNIVGNMLIFMPLGFFIPLLFDKFSNLKKVFTLGVLSSLFIEITQLFIGQNVCDIDDVIYNTTGAIIGWLCFKIFMKIVDLFNLSKKLDKVRNFNDKNIFNKSFKVVISVAILSVGYYVYAIFDQTASGNLSDIEMAREVFGYDDSQILKTSQLGKDKYYLVKDEYGITVVEMIEYINNRYADSKNGFSPIEGDKPGYVIDFIYEEGSDGSMTNSVYPIVFGKNDNASKIVMKLKDREYSFDIEEDDYFMVNFSEKVYLSDEEMSEFNSNTGDVFTVKFLDKDGNKVKTVNNLEDMELEY